MIIIGGILLVVSLFTMSWIWAGLGIIFVISGFIAEIIL